MFEPPNLPTSSEEEFHDWFRKSTVVDAAGEPTTVHRGSMNAGGAPYGKDGLVFLTASEDLAKIYARQEKGHLYHFHVRCEKRFDASRREGLTLWKQFVVETGAQSWAFVPSVIVRS